MRRVLFVGRYMFLRMVRDLPSLFVLLGLPLLLVPIFGSVFAWVPADLPYLRGAASPMAFFAFGVLVMFQLYGGAYSMIYVKNALLAPMRWRLAALPCESSVFVLGVVGASTLVSLCQGLLLVALSRIALGVRWGSLPVVVAVLVGVSLLSQLVYLSLLLLTRNQGRATALGWVYAYGSCILGGLIVPLPLDQPIFRFFVTYGTPYSLAQTALLNAAGGGSPGIALLCIALLFGASALFAGLVALLGARRLA